MTNFYGATILTGGGVGALDAIDGAAGAIQNDTILAFLKSTASR